MINAIFRRLHLKFYLFSCMLPTTVRRKPALQYLHVPKAGTSVNWFLRDYFGEACASEGLMHNTSGDRGPRLEDNPCPEWLHTVSFAQVADEVLIKYLNYLNIPMTFSAV
jgi:hypothetical protein